MNVLRNTACYGVISITYAFEKNGNACITTFRQLTPTCGYLARFLPLVEVAMVDARGDESLAP